MVHDEVTTQPSGNLDLVRSIYGTITRIVQYFERDHALADLGLTPRTNDSR